MLISKAGYQCDVKREGFVVLIVAISMCKISKQE